MSLAVLDEPRTFPPKKFFLIVWFCMLIFACFGATVPETFSTGFWVWVIIGLIAFRQIWAIRWVQVDAEGIRVRNIVGRGRELLWKDVTDVDVQEVPIRKKKAFSILKLSGTMQQRPGKTTTITIDSDTAEFDTLQTIVQSALPDKLRSE